MERSAPPKNMASEVWKSDSALGSGGCPLSSLPRATNPVSPHMTLGHSSLPLLESWVYGCKQEIVYWPFKSLPVCLIHSCVSLMGRIPPDFYSQMLYMHFFLTMVVWDGEASFRFRSHTSQEETLQLRYPSEISAAEHGNGTSPFDFSILPTRLSVASSVNPWL